MRITFFNFKGGVGKSSIAVNYAIEHNMSIVTNDVVTRLDHMGFSDYHYLEPNTKRIPKNILDLDNVVFDMGAMSGVIDAKVNSAINNSDAVVIPTLTDARSLEATLQTIDYVRDHVGTIIVIINRVTNKQRYQFALNTLAKVLPESNIFMMRQSTLFERIAADGVTWYQNINHKRGMYQLHKTRLAHNSIYDAIDQLIANRKRSADAKL